MKTFFMVEMLKDFEVTGRASLKPSGP
jgi:hypothetical protein